MPEPDNHSDKFWAIVPAAGIGKRMGSDIPKQYLSLAGKLVIEHTCQRLLDHERISGLVIALAEHDAYWDSVSLHTQKPLIRVNGGAERSDSVNNALSCLLDLAQGNNEAGVNESDWVLVHDAARPCIRAEDISKLISEVSSYGDGGLLALPVRDTMKRQIGESQRVESTVERSGLWHALTPQMFRLNSLKQALEDAVENLQPVTDESSAMELQGAKPMLVEGHEDNIKITRQPDLKLAELYLLNQQG